MVKIARTLKGEKMLKDNMLNILQESLPDTSRETLTAIADKLVHVSIEWYSPLIAEAVKRVIEAVGNEKRS